MGAQSFMSGMDQLDPISEIRLLEPLLRFPDRLLLDVEGIDLSRRSNLLGKKLGVVAVACRGIDNLIAGPDSLENKTACV
jgi:hypothetical protein